MKNLLTLLAASFLALASTSLFAQNYYVCDTGDDSNNGLSESSPFRSYEKAINTFTKISAGDSVLFCRGGVFPITTGRSIDNTNCTESSICTLADYGNSSAERPLILASGSTAISFSDAGTNTSDGGYAVKNLILMSTANQRVGVFLFRGVNNVTLDNLHVEGFSVGVQIADSSVDRITLTNSVILKNAKQGWLGGCDDCLIENNNFENNGSGIFDHNIYLSSSSYDAVATNMTVRGNTLYKSSMRDGKCEGVSLVAHGQIDNLVIENNMIKEDVGAVTPYCWGISIVPTNNKYEESFHNVVIRNNKLLNVGNVGITCGSCDGALIDNNTIIDQGSVLSHGISIPGKEKTVKSRNIKVTNNNIILGSIGNGTVGIVAGSQNPVLVHNNVISLPTDSSGECIRTQDASANIDISSNTCKNHTSVSVIDKTIDDSTKVLASAEPTSTTSTSSEPTSTASTSSEPTSTASTSSEPTSTTSTSSEPTSTTSTSSEPTITASIGSVATSTEPTTITKESKSSIKVVSLGNYKSSRGRSGGGVGFKAKCRAEAADGRCLLQ